MPRLESRNVNSQNRFSSPRRNVRCVTPTLTSVNRASSRAQRVGPLGNQRNATRRGPLFSKLKNLKNVVPNSVGLPFADSDTYDLVQPSVVWRRGFEKRRSSQIIVGCRDPFTASDPGVYLRRRMTYTTISYSPNGAED